MKTSLRIPLFILFLTGLLPFGCGDCPEPYNVMIIPQRLYVETKVFPRSKDEDTIFYADIATFQFFLGVSGHKYTVERESFFCGMQTLMATPPCPPDERLVGYNPKQDSLLIYSDQVFDGIPPGQSLNDKFWCYWNDYKHTKPDTFTSLDNLQDTFKSDFFERPTFAWRWDYYLQLRKMPQSTGPFCFQFVIYLKDGTAINGSSDWMFKAP